MKELVHVKYFVKNCDCIPWFVFLFQTADTSGFFELQLLEVSNPRGLLSGAGCCGGGTEPCSRPCRTFLRLCLKEYQSNVTTRGSCSFGNATSNVLGGNSFSLAEHGGLADGDGTLVVPFAFRWTVSHFSRRSENEVAFGRGCCLAPLPLQGAAPS